jgi:hypothetical protein
MLRATIAVIVGYSLWTVIWVGANAAFFAAAAQAASKTEPITQIPVLLGMLMTSIICSLAAGAACGRIKASTPAAAVLGTLLLLTGIAVQSGLWNLMPMWYHAAFLVALIPVTIGAAKLAGRSPRR